MLPRSVCISTIVAFTVKLLANKAVASRCFFIVYLS
ncbi:AgrD family cyclic lactone autoinducer peptide [uncultured Pseudoalteromonas sp.]